jgi:hypothetical protein
MLEAALYFLLGALIALAATWPVVENAKRETRNARRRLIGLRREINSLQCEIQAGRQGRA